MFSLGPPSEELRKKLLKEELRLRKRQPEHWAKSKYRKYANLQTKKKKEGENLKQEAEEVIEQLENKKNKPAKHKAKKIKKAKKK